MQTLKIVDNLYEGYAEIDEYCKSIRCQYIYDDNLTVLINVSDYENIEHDNIGSYEYVNGVLYMSIRYKEYTYLLDISNILTNLVYAFLFFYFTMFIAVVVIVYMVLHSERSVFIQELNAKENDLQYSMLFNVALNINHNLRSPLMVVDSVVSEFKYITDLVRESDVIFDNEEICIDDCDELVILARTAIGQINDAIAPLSDYKAVKFSNGDKSMYDLVHISLSMIRRTNLATFKEVYIDDNLKHYNVYHKNGMANSTFINMLSNHVKNSLEAASTSIKIYINKITDTYIYLYIEDDGLGIEESVREKIYQKNITTKDVDNLDSGLGLYLNLFLLTNKYDGDDYLVRSKAEEGSIFCLKMRYDPREGTE